MKKGIQVIANMVSSAMFAALIVPILASCGGTTDTGIRPFKIFGIEDNYTTSIAFSPDGKILAAGARIYNGTSTWTGAIHLWRSDDWSALSTLTLGEGKGDGGIGISFSPDGSLLAAAEPRGKLHIWRTSDWVSVKEMEIELGLSPLVAFSPGGKMLAATARGGKVWLWNVEDWTPLAALSIAQDGANAMQFSPDSSLLATGGNDEEVHLWLLSDGTRLQRLRGHTEGITSIAFSPDGQTLATGSYDKTMRLWQVSDGKLLDTWDITPAEMLFTSGGENLLVSDLWSDPKIYRVSDGTVLTKLNGDPKWDGMSPKGLSLALAPGGKTLAGGTGHSDIWLWKLP